MATAFVSDVSTSATPLARAAPKLALAASGGTVALAQALVRRGVSAGDDPKDTKLVAAWEAWRIASKAIEDNGLNGSEEVDAPHWRARGESEDVVVPTQAASILGVVAKLRLALSHCINLTSGSSWAYAALLAGDDTTLFARAGELDFDAHLLVDAIATLTRPADTTVRDAFEAWVAARLTYDSGTDHLSDKEDEALYEAINIAEEALAAAPARTAEDMLYKLLPVAMHEHGAGPGDGPYALNWQPHNRISPFLEEQAWRGLLDGLVKVSPRIAELVAMPNPQIGVAPPDQMVRWLDCLVGDGERYAKLWLRLMDAAKVEVRVEVRPEGDRLWCGSINFSPECVAADQALRAHLSASGHRQAVVDRIKARHPSPSATDLLAERQQAFAAAEDEAANDSTHDRWLSELSRLEDRIFSTPAVTKDDLLAKSLLAVRLLAEGSTIVEQQAEAILAQAQEFGLPVTDKVLREAHA